ncbi:hypothetical protein PR048_015729 [Dryococelus australis]|uniref:Uncharacterized protein n=1 Tax=Dryococelus australis TaxID=614101 RepID=A0ABQ9HHR4_9NEOP|nr:hypothetical protein PR048_015729 [Dryococelus australis]
MQSGNTYLHNPEDLHVLYDYHRTIFNEEINTVFGSPCVEMCSTCCQLESKISAESSKPGKTNITLQLKVHKKRAEIVYQFLTRPYTMQGNYIRTILPYVKDLPNRHKPKTTLAVMYGLKMSSSKVPIKLHLLFTTA